MTINIRNGVFETNSSSTHSVSLHFPLHDEGMFGTIKPDSKGNIKLHGGDFASTKIDVSSPLDKANFIAAYIMVYGNEKLKKRFESVLKEHTGAKNIVYDIRLSFTDGKPANTFFSPEYSCPEDCGYYGEGYYNEEDDEEECEEKGENPISLDAVLKSSKRLKTFLFSKKAKIYSFITYG
jgi:hypothetical protein